MKGDVLVIGAGAIGGLVAAHLARAGHAVVLVGRPRIAEAIKRDGLHLSQGSNTWVVRTVRVETSLAAAFADGKAYRLAILAVKSYDTEQVARELCSAAQNPPPLLTLQNGIGNEEILAAALGVERVLAGVITTPVTVPEPGHVVATRPGTAVGLANVSSGHAVQPLPLLRAQEAADLLRAAGMTVRVYRDWRSLKWSKLILNLLCNASCALLGWPPEQVWAHRRLANLEIAAWREAMAVMRRLGCRLVSLGGYPLSVLEPALRLLPVVWLRPLLGRFVVAGRGGKMPSLYLDLARGRQRSEVDWLNGAVVRAARQVGLSAPANQVLYSSLMAVVRGDESWSRYRDRPERLLVAWRKALEGQRRQ